MTAAEISRPSSRYDIDGFVADIGDVPVMTDPVNVRRRSRDFFWYSPVLNKQLHGLAADIIALPRDEAEIVRVAAACAKRRIPLTVRAGGTGNYGQMVPLQGGVLLDITARNAIEGGPIGPILARLGIPLLIGGDAVHGHAQARGTTVFPHNIGLGCARNESLARQRKMKRKVRDPNRALAFRSRKAAILRAQ